MLANAWLSLAFGVKKTLESTAWSATRGDKICEMAASAAAAPCDENFIASCRRKKLHIAYLCVDLGVQAEAANGGAIAASVL